ncbi:hypothetical protein DV453_003026 [Geotrichum candidum]|nr:hypothetical protein DV453_003026 [Geotrichum candidum]
MAFNQQQYQEQQLAHPNQTGGFLIPQTACTVLCCNCGRPMDGTQGTVMCTDCIKLTCDITTEIPREATVTFCRNCERFLQPPQQWIAAQPESRELLALCLRRLKGLSKVRLVDAKFIWTEPHSRRIKIKLTVQGEAIHNTLIQQSFEVEYVVVATQCPDCAKSFTVNTWRANVQIRQKVPHKRTFLYLEQLILKHNAHLDTISIKENRDGLDFYYNQRNHALKMIDFLSAVAPVKYKRSEELISMDTHTAVKSYKFSYSVEIVPICRDDLVVLPRHIAHSLGNISQVVLCHKISNNVHFLDPNTLETADISADIYWRAPFMSLANASQMVEFFVIHVEPLGPMRGRHALADVQVARMSDIQTNGQTHILRTHLGGILHPGDTAWGYYIANSNFNNSDWDNLRPGEQPDVVLVKKSYPNRRKNRGRNWKLKRMAKEHNLEDDARTTKNDLARVEQDYEMFLQELEEDQELRTTVNLYKKQPEPQKQQHEMEVEEAEEVQAAPGAVAPEVSLDELLDDFEDLDIQDA